MEKNIKSLSEIDYNSSPLITFYATVISVESEGDGEKRPAKFTLKLEDSGELLPATTWNYDLVDKLKEAAKNISVFHFQAKAGVFGTYGNQVRVGGMTDAGFPSVKKVISTVDPQEMKATIAQLMKDYIKKDSIYWKLLDTLIMKNDNFFIWPAASKMHHAYTGGLAKHSINVCKLAIDQWKNYSGENLHIDALVAGALLHDIGKLTEYDKDGNRTRHGDLIPHPVDGYRMIIEESIALGVDPISDMDVLMLSHIIISHHGKLEFGAATTPASLEAMIISNADYTDSQYEMFNDMTNNLSLYEEGRTKDGQKVIKWHL